MSTQRARLRFTFWLDMLKEQEANIAETIESLKDQRLFAQTIRDGIRLITDLRAGNLDVLFELFPWVKAEFLDYMRELQAESASTATEQPETRSEPPKKHENSDVSTAQQALKRERQQIAQLRAEQDTYEQKMRAWAEEKEKQIAAQWEHIERERERLRAEQQASQSAITQKLDKLEQMLVEQGKRVNQDTSSGGAGLRGSGGGGSGGPKSLGGPTQLGAPTLEAPNFDDEDDSDLLEVKKSSGSGSQANLNFINSVLALDDL